MTDSLTNATIRGQLTSFANKTQRDLNETQNLCRRILEKVARDGEWQGDVVHTIRRRYTHSTTATHDMAQAANVLKPLNEQSVTEMGRAVLNSLLFEEIDRRYEKIPLAYQRTFDWIFSPDSGITKWPSFHDWAKSNENPIYWIAGKPGAGKSTLMKYILDDLRLQQLLKQWAEDRPLIIASFFFWNSGSKIQMSYEGLVRTLLHQILTKDPRLIPHVLPHRVEAGMLFSERIFDNENMQWTWEELLKAFRLSLKAATVKNKITIFLDGLDECIEEPSTLIEFIDSLKLPGIKIVASSRPWVVFEDVFGRTPHLRIQDLTHQDIKHYVGSNLQSSGAFLAFQKAQPGQTDALIEAVCQKSAGVFLWVSLVTKSLVYGLSEGERPSGLQRRLDSLPDDLERLFDKILKSLDPWHLQKASQYFQIVDASIVTLNLLDMSYADEDDPEYAANAPCGMIAAEQANARAELARRRINQCCRGLLETKSKNTDELWRTVVEYLHRTVKDYLQQDSVRHTLSSKNEEGFNANHQLFNAILMRLKNVDIRVLSIRDSGETLIPFNAKSCIKHILRAHSLSTDTQTFYLNALDVCAKTVTTTQLPDGSTYLDMVTKDEAPAKHWTYLLYRDSSHSSSSFLEFAVQHQYLGYVDTTLKRMAPAERTSVLPSLIEIAEEHWNIPIINATSKLRRYPEGPNRELVKLLNRHVEALTTEDSRAHRSFLCLSLPRIKVKNTKKFPTKIHFK